MDKLKQVADELMLLGIRKMVESIANLEERVKKLEDKLNVNNKSTTEKTQ